MYLLYLVLSVIFCIYCSFKYKQAEGKNRRNDRLVRLHGDGSFLSSIVNKVMEFIWALLSLVSLLVALWAFVMYQTSDSNVKSLALRDEKVQEKARDVPQEAASQQSTPVSDKEQKVEPKNLTKKTDQVTETQEQKSLGEKNETKN